MIFEISRLLRLDDRDIDRILILFPRCEDGGEEDVILFKPFKGSDPARVSLFSVIVPVLSEQRTSTPAISSIATSLRR